MTLRNYDESIIMLKLSQNILDAENEIWPDEIDFPNDANGTGFVEIPLTTSYTGPNPFTFVTRAYDLDGSELDTSGVEMEFVFVFQST